MIARLIWILALIFIWLFAVKRQNGQHQTRFLLTKIISAFAIIVPTIETINFIHLL